MTTYWAQLNTENIVQQIITGVDDATIEGIATADWYTNFTGMQCVQTYYDLPDVKAAGIGYTYNSEANVFIEPQPYPSWTLDSNFNWQPPTPQPPAPPNTYWDEDKQSWLAFES